MPIVSTGRTISTTEYLEKKQKLRRKRQIILSSLLGLFLLALMIISRLPQIQIKEIKVTGATVTGEEAVRGKVEETLSGHYLWIIPRRNALLYGKGRMVEELSKEFPRFSSISVSLEGLQELDVSVSEREPFALYCESVESCYFVDEQGYIFDQAPTFSEGVYLVYTHTPLLEAPLGQFMIPREEFLDFKNFISALISLGFDPVEVLVSQEDVAVDLSSGAVLRWRRDGDLSSTLNNLQAFLKSATISSDEEFIEKVSELDLRTEDKVFYKFKN